MLILNQYYLGSTVRLSALFTDLLGALADPTGVVLKVRAPDDDETVTTYTYGVDVALVRDSLGTFHLDFLATDAGEYCYRWEGSGIVTAVQERQFTVLAGCFAP